MYIMVPLLGTDYPLKISCFSRCHPLASTAANLKLQLPHSNDGHLLLPHAMSHMARSGCACCGQMAGHCLVLQHFESSSVSQVRLSYMPPCLSKGSPRQLPTQSQFECQPFDLQCQRFGTERHAPPKALGTLSQQVACVLVLGANYLHLPSPSEGSSATRRWDSNGRNSGSQHRT